MKRALGQLQHGRGWGVQLEDCKSAEASRGIVLCCKRAELERLFKWMDVGCCRRSWRSAVPRACTSASLHCIVRAQPWLQRMERAPQPLRCAASVVGAADRTRRRGQRTAAWSAERGCGGSRWTRPEEGRALERHAAALTDCCARMPLHNAAEPEASRSTRQLFADASTPPIQIPVRVGKRHCRRKHVLERAE